MTQQLSGRTAIVTGAGKGLGRVIALALARAGAAVALFGQDVDRLDSVAAEIRSFGGRPIIVPCNITDEASVAEAVTALAGEEVSILINNAGIAGPVAPVVEMDPAAWDEVFAINVRGTFLMSRAFLPAMIARGSGDVINIASVGGKRFRPARSPYGASKAALIGFTQALAAEVAEQGIAVNSLSPGPVAGERMDRLFESESQRRGVTVEEVEAEFVSGAAAKRMVTEDEVGNAVLAILGMGGLIGADIDLTAGMFGH